VWIGHSCPTASSHSVHTQDVSFALQLKRSLIRFLCDDLLCETPVPSVVVLSIAAGPVRNNFFPSWLYRPHKRAHDYLPSTWAQSVNIDARGERNFARIVNPINPGSARCRSFRNCCRELRAIFVLIQRTAPRSLPTAARSSRFPAQSHLGSQRSDTANRPPASIAECFPQHAIFVSRKIDQRIRNDDVQQSCPARGCSRSHLSGT